MLPRPRPAAASLEAAAQPAAAARPQLAGHWTYVPDAVLAPAAHVSARAARTHVLAAPAPRKLESLDDEGEEAEEGGEEEVAEDPSLAVNEADEAAALADPFNGERCADHILRPAC